MLNLQCYLFLPEEGTERAGDFRPSLVEAAMSALFLIGYDAVRFVPEFFREPDAGIFGLSYTISMGQWLSLPMIAAGVAMLLWSKKAVPQ